MTLTRSIVPSKASWPQQSVIYDDVRVCVFIAELNNEPRSLQRRNSHGSPTCHHGRKI